MGEGKTATDSRHREMLQKRVAELTQPIAEHEIAELDLDTRQGLTRRTGSIVLMAIVLLVAVVGAVLGIRLLFSGDSPQGNAGGEAKPHALSVPTDGDGANSESDSGAPHDKAVMDGAGSDGAEAQGKAAGAANEPQGGSERNPPGNGIIVVSVQGMVAHPGLLRVKSGLRVGDVIELAGPTHPRARLHNLNLAQQVADGMQIVVDPKGSTLVLAVTPHSADPSLTDAPGSPSRAQPGAEGASGRSGAGGSQAGTGTSAGEKATGKVNINTADQSSLETLSGVGPATAKAIIEWRQANGKFRSVEQLMEVRGIGPAKFAAMKDSVTV